MGLFAGFLFNRGFSVILNSCFCCASGSTPKPPSPQTPSNCCSSSSFFSEVDEFFLEVSLLFSVTPVGELFVDSTLRNPLLVALLRKSFLLLLLVGLRFGATITLGSADGEPGRVPLPVDDGILILIVLYLCKY
jgi:hypothetical protein